MTKNLPSLREDNMNQRRMRIRAAAREIILSEGYQALTTRKVAALAGVTAPTVYNLIGPMEDILAGLVDEGLNVIEGELTAISRDLTGLETAERIVTVSIEVFSADADAYKAFTMAAEHQAMTAGPQPSGANLIERCTRLQINALTRARAEGDLRGELDVRLLAAHILSAFRTALRRWALGQLDDEGFRSEALHGLAVCLLADASEEARPRLQKMARDAEWAIAKAGRSKKKKPQEI